MSFKQVQTFLASVGLSSYAETLRTEGYDTIDRLTLLSNLDLQAMGFPRGHRAALLNAVKSLDKSAAPAKPVPAAPSPLMTSVIAPPAARRGAPILPAAAVSRRLSTTHEASEEETDHNLGLLRASLYKHGARGIVGLGRKFRIIDDNGDGRLDYSEFRKAMSEHSLLFSERDMKALFNRFDDDNSGDISHDEFLVGVRGELNPFRKRLVGMAFNVLDEDGSGIIELMEVVKFYDASNHPKVQSGEKSANEVFRTFLDTFDGGEKDGQVTLREFERYYANISASIDSDEYFELMIRNAWHLSGGKGRAANTTCRRVLVTHPDGSQTVEEITNDIGIGRNDIAAMKRNLAARGITAVDISLTGNASSDRSKAGGASLAASAPVARRTRRPVSPAGRELSSPFSTSEPPLPAAGGVSPRSRGRRMGTKGVHSSSIIFG